MLHKHIDTCRHFIVRHHKYAWAFMGFAILVVGSVYFKKEFIDAATAYNFTQSSFTGGISTTTANHTSNRTGWNNYDSLSSGVVAGATVSLSSTAKSVTDDGIPGALSALPDPIAAGADPWGITVSPDGRSVYVTNYKSIGTISMFSRDATTGVLLSIGTIASGPSPISVIVSPDGKSVYAVSDDASGPISMYSRDTTSGVLTALPTPFINSGDYASSITISPDGASVYVGGYYNALFMYSRDLSTGALTPLSPSASIAMGGSNGNPFGITVSPDGKSVYVTAPGNGDINMYARDTVTGALADLGAIDAGNPYSVTVSPDGKSVYVANKQTNGTVRMYSRNTTSGVLTALSPHSISAGNEPYSITISPDGAAVYVANYRSHNMSMYSRNATTGALSSVGTIATGANPGGVTISPNGESVYVSNSGPYTVSQYSRGGAKGTTGFESGTNSMTALTKFVSGTNVSVMLSDGEPAISAGYRYTLTRKGDGTLWAYGDNTYGQLGVGVVTNADESTSTFSGTPLQVSIGNTYTAISAGRDHSLAIKTDGTLWAWGRNNSGQLGISNEVDKNTPVKIGEDTYIAISAGGDHSLAIKTDGTLWAWGGNSSGQLGDVTNTASSIPVPVSIGNTYTAISAGRDHSLAIKTDGTLWAWGLNNRGQLGISNQVDKNTPVQVGNNTYTAISAGDNHSVAIKTDGTLWAWGHNSTAQLGLGNTQQRTSPVQVGDATYITISAGGSHSLAIRTGGTLWSWGYGENGALGLGNHNLDRYFTSPQQVSMGSTFATIAAGKDANDGGMGHSLAIRVDGMLLGFGYNNVGQLGRGTHDTIRGFCATLRETLLSSVIAYSSGTFTSAIINLKGKANPTTMTWANTLPDGTGITMEVSGSADNVTWGSYATIANSGDSISYLVGSQYIQYRATLTTTNPAVTPTLDSVTINYNQYTPAGSLTSSVYDTSTAGNVSLISSLTWTETGTSADETVKFQVRSSMDGVLWSAWCGYTNCSGSTYFNSAQNGVTLAEGHPLQNGGNDQYLQYKAFLYSGGSATPTLTAVTVSYQTDHTPIFTFTQSNFDGGTSATIANHASNQTGWSVYESANGLSPVYSNAMPVMESNTTTGDLTSSVYNTRLTDNGVSRVAWTAIGITDTASIKLQVRSASTAEGLAIAPWCGQVESTGTCTGENFFTTSGVEMVLGTHPLNTGSNDKYIQYKALFTDSLGLGQLALSSADISYVLMDVVAPVITSSPAGGSMRIYVGSTYTEAVVTATDTRDGAITVVKTGSVNTAAVGTYTITYTATDLAGNIATSTRTVNVLAVPIYAQILINNTTVSTILREVLVGYNNTESSIITIPSTVTNATINVSALTTSTATTTTAVLQGAIVINAATSIGAVSMEIPAGITITAGIPNWNGIINAPQVKANSTVTVTADSGITATVFSVIEVGYGDIKLVFDKAVKLVLSGQSGKEAGYSRAGVFTEINTICSADTQAAGDDLPAEGDCYINVDSDLIIWTKHFTNFVTYTLAVTPVTSVSYSGGGSYVYIAPTPTPVLKIDTTTKPISVVPGCVTGDTHSATTGKECFPTLVQKPVPVIKAPVKAPKPTPKLALAPKPVPTIVEPKAVEPTPEPVLTPEPAKTPEVKQNFATTITNTFSIVIEYLGSIMKSIWGWFAN